MSQIFPRRGLGYKPDLRHLLGAPVRNAAAKLAGLPTPPPSASIESAVVDILDQGSAPFCVSHGIAQALRCCQILSAVRSPRLASRLWIMYLAHAIEHDVDGFDGAFVQDGFQVLEQLGFPPEQVWPYDDRTDGNYRVKPPADVFRQAFDRIAPLDYSRILTFGDERIDDVKRALAAGHPVVFGTQVSESFCNGETGPGFTVDTPVGIPMAGGHCLLSVGYDSNDRFRVVNSWSEAWGDRGKFWMTADYMAAPDTIDIWIADFQGLQP